MTALSIPHLGLRALQVAASVVALVLAPRSFASAGFQLSAKSMAAIYLPNYSALMCGAYYAVVVRALRLSKTPCKPLNQRLIDVLLVAALVVGATMERSNDVIPNCQVRETYFESRGTVVFRCGAQAASIVATYINAGLFVASLALSLFARDSLTMRNHEEEPSTSDYASVQTPVKATPDRVTAHIGTRIVRLGSRAVQLIASVAVVAVLLIGYNKYEGGHVTAMAVYCVLSAYSSALFACWHLAAVETLQLTAHPRLIVERTIDGVLAVAVLVGAVLVSTSSVVRDCASDGECGHLTASYIFLFVVFAAQMCSFTFSFSVSEEGECARDSCSTYVEHSVANTSEVNAATAV